MTLEVEIKLHWIDHFGINDGPCGAITALVPIGRSLREETNVVAFANNDHGDRGLDAKVGAGLWKEVSGR